MKLGRPAFTQIVDLVHRKRFDRCVSKHPMPRKGKGFTARDQFLCAAFARLTFSESLRDIEASRWDGIDPIPPDDEPVIYTD